MPLVYIFFGVLLVWLSLPLRHTWSDGTYYDYGWLIPPIIAWFFYRRWKLIAKESIQRPKKNNPSKSRWWPVIIAGAVFLFAALTIRTLEQVDVTWRPVLWFHSILVFAFIHFIVALLIGWRKSLSFWPITLLGLMATPLPSSIENQLVGAMTAKVTDASVLSLQWMGFPVQANGGTISGPGGTVEVGKACSGIRSFQAILVTAWFFGEFLWCRLWARFALLTVGIIAAFVTNAIRAVTLAWLQFEHGEEAFSKWHDPVGYIAFATAGLILFLVARTLDQPEPQSDSQPNSDPQKPLQIIRLCCVCIAILALIEIGNFIHFRNNSPSTERLTYQFPTNESPDFKRINIDILPESDILKFDDGGSGVFFSEDKKISMRTVYLEYKRGNPRFWMDLFAHAPEVCMGSVGARLVKRYPNRKATISGYPLEFESLKFINPANETVFIFKGYWLESALPDQLENLRSLRLEMAKKGDRSPEGRLFWGATTNIENEDEAWNFFYEKYIGNVKKSKKT